MCTWSHYKFRLRLHDKAREFAGVEIIDTTEEFTSKTCGSCGYIKNDLGKNKTYQCDKCTFDADRDFNGARNVLIRHLTKHTQLTMGSQ